jgi:hypothetical protein
MKSKAILFGLNYSHCKNVNKLNGCINDVINMKDYLTTECDIPCDVYTDDGEDFYGTTKQGMLGKLYELVNLSHTEPLDFVLIHYSGHGSYVKDTNFDECDGRDECLCPSDCETNGYILDDEISQILSQFNVHTRVVCIFDCCHSATICDVKYSWEGSTKKRIENFNPRIKSKVITLSGCLDNQTSADAYIQEKSNYAGALTNALLSILKSNGAVLNNNIFKLVDELRSNLKQEGYEQVPKLCSTYNLTKDKRFIL